MLLDSGAVTYITNSQARVVKPTVKKKLSGGPPRGRPPKDKTWDYEKQEWVATGSAPAPKKPVASPKPKILLESGGYKRPVGRPPAGKVWDTASGEYVQQSEQLAIK